MESTVLAVRKETPDTVTIRVAAPFSFAPGQFAMVGVSIEGKEIKRSYSIASLSNSEWIEVTVKEQHPGLFSAYAQHLEAGDAINVYGPFGHHFNFDFTLQNVVFIAGGSGISPFRAMLLAAKENGYTGKITLLYSVKTSADVIYAAELEELSRTLPFTLVITLTRPTEQEMTNWKGKFGRVTAKLLTDTLGDVTAKHYYICGPTTMVQDVQILLQRLNVPKEQVKTEKFGMIEG
jgi:ferredoxin-NADP reductase